MRELLVGDIFRQCARATPHRTAVVATGEQLTFGQLDEQSDRMSNWLQQRTQPGDRVVMWTRSCVDTAVLFAATAKAGVAFCPLNPDAPVADAARAIELVEPAVIVGDEAHAATATSLLADTNSCAIIEWSELRSHTPTGDAAPTFPDSTPQFMVFTSGTTGLPKAAVISHRAQYLRSHPGAQYEPRGMGICVYPLFHVAPWLLAIQQWHARDGIAFTPDTQPATIADAVAEHHATRLNMIPALWRRLIDHLEGVEPATGPLATLRFADTGTSATPLPLLQAIQGLVPQANVRVFYGSTEAGNVCGLDHADIDAHPGSIGVPSVSTEIHIDDAGELLVRSPLLFDGYFNNPAETSAALDDGWYRTGDLADVDDDGYISIVGRAKDIIRSGGESVAPSEVESLLRSIPGIDDVAVVGIPHVDWGEVVCAVVVTKPGTTVDLDHLQSHCAGKLATFKQPRQLVTVDSIPRTASTGQPQRPLIIDMVTARSG